MSLNVESAFGISDGWGFAYLLTSVNAVTKRLPLFGFLTRNDGLMYSAVTPRSSGLAKTRNASRSSNCCLILLNDF